MTPANLTEIEESLKRITQGEWRSTFSNEIYSKDWRGVVTIKRSNSYSEPDSIQIAEHDRAFIANAPAYVATLVREVRELREVIQDTLSHNGGPIDADDTVDEMEYVMVRRSDFDRLQELNKAQL